MQGLARFSLVAVIVLAAILLGSWAYLTARYGSIEEYMVSEDGPYWRPGSHSEAHDDPQVEEVRSLTERTADAVKSGKIPEDESGDWRKAEPEKTPEASAPKSAEAAPQNTIEARIDTEYSDLAIDTEEGTLKRGDSQSSLNPFFVRTRPIASDRAGFTASRAYMIAASKGGADSPELQELHKQGYTLIRGKVVDDQKLEGIENVVVAPVADKGEVMSMRAVTNMAGEFVLYLSKDDNKQCGATARKANLCVIADGANPKASRVEKYQLNSEADSNGAHEIKLEKSRGLRVRVRVTNPRPIDEAVRVWCELRDESGPTFDDHIFMGLIAPARGDIVFRLPRGHFGQVRVGACGNGWAADAVETNRLSKDLVTVQVTLRPARTELCKGVVCSAWYENGQTDGSLSAARIAATESTDITYTDRDGRFEFFARKLSDTMLLRITNTEGFARSYKLEVVSKGEEDRGLTRTLFDIRKQAYEWQFLAPTEVALTVQLDRLEEDERSMLLYCVPPMAKARRSSTKEETNEIWRGSVGVSKRTLEYKIGNTGWGARAFVLFTREGAGNFSPLATYTCDAYFWDDPEVALAYPTPGGRCVVTVRMSITRN